MKNIILSTCLASSLFLSGCVVVVGDTARELISLQRVNAEDFADAVKQDEEVPAYVQEWIELEAESWKFFENWSRGQKPETTEDN